MLSLLTASPSPSLLTQCHLVPLSVAHATSVPLFVTCGDISPRRGENLSRPGEVYQSERLWQCGQLSGFAKASPFEERLPPRRGKMSQSDKRGESVEHCETERARPLARSEQVKGSARFLSFLFASFFRLMDVKIVLGYNKDKIVLRFAK